MTRDWVAWHRDYDNPQSSLARRLRVVQDFIRQAMQQLAVERPIALRILSLCAGDGRDLLPVLAEGHDLPARALLVEQDPHLAEHARRRAAELDLSGVDVACGDAGDTTVYANHAPAHLVLACGVFGNITTDDARTTVAALRRLTLPGGFVIWTRARESTTDPSFDLRSWFIDEGFTERVFSAPEDERFRVGMNQLSLGRAQPFRPGVRMFSFTDQ